MKTVRLVYYGNTGKKKVAVFKIMNDDTLELLSTKEYVSPVINSNNLNKTNINNIKIFNGVGDVFASITKLFGFKPCAPCDRRRKY